MTAKKWVLFHQAEKCLLPWVLIPKSGMETTIYFAPSSITIGYASFISNPPVDLVRTIWYRGLFQSPASDDRLGKFFIRFTVADDAFSFTVFHINIVIGAVPFENPAVLLKKFYQIVRLHDNLLAIILYTMFVYKAIPSLNFVCLVRKRKSPAEFAGLL